MFDITLLQEFSAVPLTSNLRPIFLAIRSIYLQMRKANLPASYLLPFTNSSFLLVIQNFRRMRREIGNENRKSRRRKTADMSVSMPENMRNF